MATAYPKLPLLILPLTRREVPGWARLYRLFGVDSSQAERWKDAPTRTIRGKLHGFRMRLRLSNWSERMTYFLGRFYDLPLQLLLMETLRPGDRFVDVGTNIGMVTLLASKLVGPGGRVDSFEPNPECCRMITQTLEENRIGNVRLHPYGVSDRAGEATLSLVTDHSGMGTLAEVSDEDRALVTGSVAVRTVVGDEALDDDAGPIVMLKIDVEGFEMRVLRGMRRLIEAHRPVIVTEVVESHLRRDGMTRKDLVEFLSGLGYAPYNLTQRKVGMHHRLKLEPIQNPEGTPHTDFVWLNREGEPSSRLDAYRRAGS